MKPVKYLVVFLFWLIFFQLLDYYFYASHLSQTNDRFVFGFIGNNLTASTVAVIFLSLIYIIIPKTKAILLLFSILSAGTISNIIERIFYGGAIDYINIWLVPSFNPSDIAIVMMVGLITICLLKNKFYDNKYLF